MEKTLKELVNSSPLKKKFIAKHIDVNPSVLSMCLAGERTLSADKEIKLKELLKMVS